MWRLFRELNGKPFDRPCLTMFEPSRSHLLLSMQRALLGNVSPALRQASIEAKPSARVVRMRFEYAAEGSEWAQDLCSTAAAEVLSDLPADWDIEEEHLSVGDDAPLRPLACVAYRRGEEPHTPA
jgi:hypothetical protein